MSQDRREPPHRGNLRAGRRSEPGRPYHITKCLIRPPPCSLHNEPVARIIVDSLQWHQANGYAHLLAFVIMPDHVHWLFVLGTGSAGSVAERKQPVGFYLSRPQIASAQGINRREPESPLSEESKTPSRDLAALMEGFGKYTSLRINRMLGRKGTLWEEGYHDHAIRTDEEEALTVLEYIHSNPVRKGLCQRPEDWPWSTANPKYKDWIERKWLW